MQPLLKKIPGSAPVELIWVYFVAVCPSPTKLNLTTLLHVYLSFSPSLILVTSTEGGPRGFSYQGLSPQYTHTKSKTIRCGWSLIQRLVVLLLATEGRSVIRSYDLGKKKKKTKSSPQLFQDSEC